MYDRPSDLAYRALIVCALVTGAIITGSLLAGIVWYFGWWGVFYISVLLFIAYNARNTYWADTAAELTQIARNPFFRGLRENPGETPAWAMKLVEEEDAMRQGRMPRRRREAWVINGTLITIAVVSLLLSN